MKLVRQIMATGMALLILVSTTGFTISAHYCGGDLRSIGLFSTTGSCAEKARQLPPCHQKSEVTDTPEKTPCCENQTIARSDLSSFTEVVKLKELKPDFKLSAVAARFIVAIVAANGTLSSHQTHYLPPLIERDLPVLVQSFLL